MRDEVAKKMAERSDNESNKWVRDEFPDSCADYRVNSNVHRCGQYVIL